ncbi:unnamed protein product [Prorocentrum cordatum]|uniref:Exportin-T n=1 Tax=Prorocentrum cordatum TaxID=2364126 RepID=A0ABN9XXB7_9DINO|nr:unnamed protein product [Polarella glacialis]
MQPASATADRQVCIARVLPALVAATGPAEAAPRLSAFTAGLLDHGGRAGLADALGMAVAFHGPLLGHWRLASLAGDHDDLGRRLVREGLKAGLLKELAGLRKQARFLLESSAQAALAADGAEGRLAALGVSGASTVAAWRCFWELFGSIEEYSSHLLKAGWEALVGRLMQFFRSLNQSCFSDPAQLPPALPGPQWFEVFLSRALDHGNDSVQKFVLGQLIALDQGSARLSESFILEEMLPQFSHSIDVLYPHTDVHQAFEKQTAAFFSGFVAHHPQGRAEAAARLLRAVLRVRAVHYTPLRLVLSVLSQADAPGALEAVEALAIMRACFETTLARMPVSVRPVLAPLLVNALTKLCSDGGAETAQVAEARMPELLAEAVAVVPDSLLPSVQAPLAALSLRSLGVCAAAATTEFLGALAAPGGAAAGALAEVSPMRAGQLALGGVRVLWALSSLECADARPFQAHEFSIASNLNHAVEGSGAWNGSKEPSPQKAYQNALGSHLFQDELEVTIRKRLAACYGSSFTFLQTFVAFGARPGISSDHFHSHESGQF